MGLDGAESHARTLRRAARKPVRAQGLRRGRGGGHLPSGRLRFGAEDRAETQSPGNDPGKRGAGVRATGLFPGARRHDALPRLRQEGARTRPSDRWPGNHRAGGLYRGTTPRAAGCRGPVAQPAHRGWRMTPSIDPITLEVISTSLAGVVQEMQSSLFRTGYSTIIRETQDASCALLDRDGRLVAQHIVLALHMGAFPACTSGLLAAHPSATMQPGDAFLVNHPYAGGSPHAPDMAVLTPIFYRNELVGFAGSIAHKSDIGGPVPGSCSGQARETFNEGLHLPAVRYQRKFESQTDIDRIIAANSRTPELVLGDIRGQLGADRLGERRVNELVAKFGKDKVEQSFARLFEIGEARRSPAFRFFRLRRSNAWPGQYPPAAGAGGLRLCADLDGRPAHVRVERAAARIHHRSPRRQCAQSALPGAGQHLQSDCACAGRCAVRRAGADRAG